jgi:hypothetical protein
VVDLPVAVEAEDDRLGDVGRLALDAEALRQSAKARLSST